MDWASRQRFFSELKTHWAFKLIIWLYGAFTLFVVIRDNLLSAEQQRRLATLALIGRVPGAWYWWVLGFCVLVILVIFEKGHAAFRGLREQQCPEPIPVAPQASTQAPALPPITFAPVITQTQGGQQQHQEEAQAAAVARAPQPLKEKRYNFAVSEPRRVQVIEERDQYSIAPRFYSGYITAQSAIVIELTNRSHKDFSIDFANDVTAALIAGGHHVTPLTWIESTKPMIDFYSDQPQTLVLAVRATHGDEWLIPRYLPRSTEYGYRYINVEHQLPPGHEMEMTVQLGRSGKVIHEIQLALKWNHNGVPALLLKP